MSWFFDGKTYNEPVLDSHTFIGVSKIDFEGAERAPYDN